MSYAEYETENGFGFALCSTSDRKQLIQGENRKRVCQLLQVAESDPRGTYELWGAHKQDGRPSRPNNGNGNGNGNPPSNHPPPPNGDPPNGPPLGGGKPPRPKDRS